MYEISRERKQKSKNEVTRDGNSIEFVEIHHEIGHSTTAVYRIKFEFNQQIQNGKKQGIFVEKSHF